MTEQQPQASSSDAPQEESVNIRKPILRISYKVPLSVRLRSILNTVSSFFRTMKAPYNSPENAEELLPIRHGYRFVDSYPDRLRLLYAEPETQHISQSRWQVTAIRTYKDKKTKVRHEYLVATLFDDYQNTILLRIERRSWDSVIKSIGQNIVRGSLRGASPTIPPVDGTPANEDSAKEKDQEKFQKRALDQISILKPSKFNVKQVPVEHIVFKSDDNHKLPTLVDLIILAHTVSDYSRVYHLTETNCYWFCYITSEILKINFLYDRPDLPTRDLQGKWSWLGIKGGKVYKEVKFPEVDKNYQNMRDKFKQRIDAMVHNPNNKYTIEAKQEAEAERKRAEELEKRIEEEQKRVEVVERSRQEEKIEMERRIAALEARLAQVEAT